MSSSITHGTINRIFLEDWKSRKSAPDHEKLFFLAGGCQYLSWIWSSGSSDWAEFVSKQNYLIFRMFTCSTLPPTWHSEWIPAAFGSEVKDKNKEWNELIIG